jgi:glycosyltransferase involved in cell wall biosynthesis
VERRFEPVRDEEQLAKARLVLGVKEAPFILSLGVLEPRKNLNTLMDAFAILKRSGKAPDHKLVLAGGKGWLVDGILAHYSDSPVHDDILFPGFVPDDLLPAIYTAADVLAFPSLYEGFGLPILEAMACGAPVVSSNTSCLPEVAEGAAMLVAPDRAEELAAALEQALTDESLRADLRRRGRARAAQYTWRGAAEKLLNVYRRLGAA